MTLALFYDTESTGVGKDAHLVQLAAILFDLDACLPRNVMNVIIKPDGWVIPPEAIAVHGISTGQALRDGIPEKLAISMFSDMWRGRKRVGHNEHFDARMIKLAASRVKHQMLDRWEAHTDTECTSKMSRNIVKALDVRGRVKAPRLAEAYRHFFKTDFENAHDALADVEACIAVYLACREFTDKPANSENLHREQKTEPSQQDPNPEEGLLRSIAGIRKLSPAYAACNFCHMPAPKKDLTVEKVSPPDYFEVWVCKEKECLDKVNKIKRLNQPQDHTK